MAGTTTTAKGTTAAAAHKTPTTTTPTSPTTAAPTAIRGGGRTESRDGKLHGGNPWINGLRHATNGSSGGETMTKAEEKEEEEEGIGTIGEEKRTEREQ